ncbi:MAG: DUF4331 domain-containing protein [Pseudomonadota bacterium]
MHSHCARYALRASALTLTIATALGSAHAASHREAPYIAQHPRVDATDFYLFTSYEGGRSDYITLIANYSPLQDAYAGPNYFSLDERAIYEMHIDNNGDALEDITLQFAVSNTLGAEGDGAALVIDGVSVPVPLKALGPIDETRQANANFVETYSLVQVLGDRRQGNSQVVTSATDGSTSFAKPLDYFGEKTFGDSLSYTRYVAALSNSGNSYNDVVFPACPAGAQDGRVFVGQRAEPFAANLGPIFDLVNLDPINLIDDPANNDLAGKNITTIAVEMHKQCLVGGGNGVIGAWTTASLPQFSILNPTPQFDSPEVVGGAWTQVSRLGAPLVNEVVIGLDDKDRFNASEPKDDAQFARYVTHPTLPAIVDLLFNGDKSLDANSIAPNNYPRADLVAAFLTGIAGVNQLSTTTPSEMLRLNTGVAPTVAGAQSELGVVAGDLAGFPNGRRPGDDVIDIALRAAMGALCHGVNLDLNGDSLVNEDDNLLLCDTTPTASRSRAPVGAVAFRDGAPQRATQFTDVFPYLQSPYPGARN